MHERFWTFWRVPIANNVLLRMHWAARRKDSIAWRYLVREKCGPPPFNTMKQLGKVYLKITAFRWSLQDPDNAHASVKPLVDAIRKEGWLRDDSKRWLLLDVDELVDRRKGYRRTEVSWKPIKS